MIIGPLHFWSPLNSNGARVAGVCVAALHWPSSSTWSWAIYWHPWMDGFTNAGLHRHGRLRAGSISLNIPKLGCFKFCTQTPMWRKARPSNLTTH